jgi:hypothetical protein
MSSSPLPKRPTTRKSHVDEMDPGEEGEEVEPPTHPRLPSGVFDPRPATMQTFMELIEEETAKARAAMLKSMGQWVAFKYTNEDGADCQAVFTSNAQMQRLMAHAKAAIELGPLDALSERVFLRMQSHRDEYKKTIGAHPSYDNANGLFAQVSVHIGFSAEHHSKCLKVCLTEHPEVNFEVSCSDTSKELRNAMLRYQRGDEGGAPDAELKYMEQYLRLVKKKLAAAFKSHCLREGKGCCHCGVFPIQQREVTFWMRKLRDLSQSIIKRAREELPHLTELFDQNKRPLAEVSAIADEVMGLNGTLGVGCKECVRLDGVATGAAMQKAQDDLKKTLEAAGGDQDALPAVVIAVAMDILNRAAIDGDEVRKIHETLRAEAKKAEEDARLAVYASRYHPASNDAEDQPPLSDLSLSEPSPPKDETEGPAAYTLIFLTERREQKLRCRQDVVLGDLIRQNREYLTGWSLKSDARVYSGDGRRLSLLSTLAELGLDDGETLEEVREQTGGAGGDKAAREEPMPLEVQQEQLRQLNEFMDAERSESGSSGDDMDAERSESGSSGDDMEPAAHEDAASNETPLTGEKWPTGQVEEQQAGVDGDADQDADHEEAPPAGDD